MNSLVNSLNNASTTENGAIAYKSSSSKIVDLFFVAGASRGKDISKLFQEAFNEDADRTTRILMWLRDARAGAGERKTSLNLLLTLPEKIQLNYLDHLSNFGRYKDLVEFEILLHTKDKLSKDLSSKIYTCLNSALNNGDKLCAKWMPRQKSVKRYYGDKKDAPDNVLQIAYNGFINRYCRNFNLSIKTYRKTLTSILEDSPTVETLLCEQQFDSIDYSKLPSKAALRYQKTFRRHDEVRYKEYMDSLVKGTTKVNSSVLFPHEIYRAFENDGVSEVLDAQWNALPNYLEGCKHTILPVIDVSGSMTEGNGKVVPLEVSVSLGLYLSERCVGDFKNHFFTFARSPSFLKVPEGSLSKKMEYIKKSEWGYNTDLVAVFKMLLSHATNKKSSQEEFPDAIIIISDMQFDKAISHESPFDTIRNLFKDSGYSMPKIIFWNVNATLGTNPVDSINNECLLVSGFSPTIMKSIVKNLNVDTLELIDEAISKYPSIV